LTFQAKKLTTAISAIHEMRGMISALAQFERSRAHRLRQDVCLQQAGARHQFGLGGA
jgi:hypothetical protein